MYVTVVMYAWKTCHEMSMLMGVDLSTRSNGLLVAANEATLEMKEGGMKTNTRMEEYKQQKIPYQKVKGFDFN